MVVVEQDDAAARSHGADHRADHVLRCAVVLEEEARVREVEAAGLVVAERRRLGPPGAELDERRLTVVDGEALGRGALRVVRFDAEDARALTQRAREYTRELAQAAAEIERGVLAARRDRPQAGLVDQRVQPREPILLRRGAAVEVAQRGASS